MFRFARGYSASAGIVVVALVVIVGALGFAYVTHLNSQMASTHTTQKTQPTATQLPAAAAPTTIATTDDLDASLSTLDATQVDESGDDLESLIQATSGL